MAKVNLLYIITKLELGGAQKQLLSLISRLNKDKFRIFLLTAKEGLLLPEALSISGLTVKKSRWLERPINPITDLLTFIEIYRFIKYNNIKIVHTHSSKAGILGRFAARLAKVKIILHTVHGWSFNGYQLKFWQWIFICLEKIAAQFTDKLIVVSQYDKLKGLSIHIGEEKTYSLIRPGIDYTEFNGIKDATIREELGIKPEDLTVGMISCFKPQKCPLDFIKLAFLINQTMPNIKFLLAGDGALRADVEKLINQFNLKQQVILTGWRRDISRILSAIDVFVLTSLWEGLPICVLEAMAASRAVIATDTGGIAEVISEGKTGFVVPRRNMEKMSERLVLLLKDQNLRLQIGKNAKDSLSEGFSLGNMAKNSEDIYASLIREDEAYA